WMVCSNGACRKRMREVWWHVVPKCPIRSCGSEMELEYNDSMLYTQLAYLEDVVISLYENDRPASDKVAARGLRGLMSKVMRYHSRDKFHFVGGLIVPRN